MHVVMHELLSITFAMTSIMCCRKNVVGIREVADARCVLLQRDGTPQVEALAPVAVQLTRLVLAQQWAEAARVCYRFQV